MEKRTSSRDANLRERETEATEKETLKDLEESFGNLVEPESEDLLRPDGSPHRDRERKQSD